VKVAVIGAAAVGAATALLLIERNGMCREVVVLDRKTERANGVAIDMRYATPLSPTVDVRAGGYDALAGAALVIITAGVNGKAGGATDRSDGQGRLRLLDTNAKVYADVVPKVMAIAPQAVLMVVTDPPDPLADLTRQLAGHDRVFSTGHLDRQPALPHAYGRPAAGTAPRRPGDGSRRTRHLRSAVVVISIGERRSGL
jgi:L-lactate dehydrogenase